MKHGRGYVYDLYYSSDKSSFAGFDELEPHTLLFVSKALFLFSVIFLK